MRSMKNILYVALLSVMALTGSAQEGILKAKVLSDEQALSFVNVSLTNGKEFYGTSTDEQGAFIIHSIVSDTYTLSLSCINYEPLQVELTIKAGQVIEKEWQMTQSNMLLDQVVISATRYQLRQQDAPVKVAVLDSRTLQAAQSMVISEGMNLQAGVRVEANCQNCGFTQVRLNGLEGPYTQILVNNRAVFSALNSVYGLEQIPAAMVEQIEVVRGGGSALYGSNAIAGTVNIITKKPTFNTWSISSNLGWLRGRRPDHTLQFNTSIVNEELTSGVSFFGMRRDRSSLDADGDGFTELVQLNNQTFGAQAYHEFTEQHKIRFNFSSIQEYRRGGDRLKLAPHFTDIAEELDHNTLMGGLEYEWSSKDGDIQITTYASYQNTVRESYYGGLGGGRTQADSLLAQNAYGQTLDQAFVGGVQASIKLREQDRLVLGAEQQLYDVVDQIEGYGREIDQNVATTGLFAQYEWSPIRKFTILGGLRLDHTEVRGLYTLGSIVRENELSTSIFSPRMTLLYKLHRDWQLRATYGRGFRAPQAFNEDLHISSVGGETQFVLLSEGLTNETSDAYTLSLDYTHLFGRWQTKLAIDGFYNRLNNPFTLVSTGAILPNGSIVEEVRNGNGAYVAGLNFEASTSPSAHWYFQIGGTVQEARYLEDQIIFEGEEGTEVAIDEFIRNPNLYGFISSTYRSDYHWKVDVTGTYTGSMIVPRVVGANGEISLIDSETFLDLNVKWSYQWKLSKDFSLQFMTGVQNILDSFQSEFDQGPMRDADFVYGPLRPRTFFIGVKLGNFYE